MFSRLSLGIVLLSVLLSSCTLRLKDAEPPRAQVAVNPVKGGCLKNAGQVFDRYFNGEISEPDLDEFWTCVRRSVVTFTQNSKGKEINKYAPEELGNFLSYYFLGKRTIPGSLLIEAMKLKAGIIGGSTSSISSQDLKVTIELIDVLRTETLRLRTHLPLSPQAIFAKHLSETQFESTISVLTTAMANIGTALKGNLGVYSFQSMKALILELRSFFYDNTMRDNDWTEVALKTIDIAKTAKVIFLSPPAEELRADDWSKLFQILPRAYAVYLRANHYLAAPRDALSGVGMRRLSSLIDEAFSLSDQAIENHADAKIRYADLEVFFDSIDSNGKLPIGKETLQHLFWLIFGKWFPTESPDGEIYITHASVDRIRNLVNYWTEGTVAIEAAYKKLSKDDEWYTQSYERDDLLKIEEQFLFSSTVKKTTVSREAVQGVIDTIRNIKTIVPAGQKIVVIPRGEASSLLSAEFLIKSQLYRTANKLVLENYGRTEKGKAITKTEFQELLEDVFPVLVDFKLLSADTKATLISRFFEGNLFLYASDGQLSPGKKNTGEAITEPALDMHEALELEFVLLSTVEKGKAMHEAFARPCSVEKQKQLGLDKMAPELAAEMDSYCNDDSVSGDQEYSTAKIHDYCDRTTRDEAGRLLIHPSCFRARVMKHYMTLWNYIPAFQSYFRKIPREKKIEMISLLDGFTRANRTDGWYTSTDTNAYVLMPYYVDIIFSRYDLDQSGFIENGEGDVAYDVFKSELAKKATELGYSKPEDHYKIYKYLLANAEMPNASIIDKLSYVLIGTGNYAADRGQIIKTLSRLMQLLVVK